LAFLELREVWCYRCYTVEETSVGQTFSRLILVDVGATRHLSGERTAEM
jgi:hypothetical protein